MVHGKRRKRYGTARTAHARDVELIVAGLFKFRKIRDESCSWVSGLRTGPETLPLKTVEPSATRTTVKFVQGAAIDACFVAGGR